MQSPGQNIKYYQMSNSFPFFSTPPLWGDFLDEIVRDDTQLLSLMSLNWQAEGVYESMYRSSFVFVLVKLLVSLSAPASGLFWHDLTA